LAAIKKYRREKPEWQEYAHPATWLNQRRWEDQYGQEAQSQEWPEWKHKLARKIGEPNVLSWFNRAEMNGKAIYFDQKFQLDLVRYAFMPDIKEIFGENYSVELREAK
jgi:hypothetical protein